MVGILLNEQHLAGALVEAIERSRHRLFIATADVKDLHVPMAWRIDRAQSILAVLDELSKRSVEIRLLHSGVPSGPFLARMKLHLPPTLTMRRCPRIHAKALIADGRWMYLGSANLTGAGLGAKGEHRRNFELGVVTSDASLLDEVQGFYDAIWRGGECGPCKRRDVCEAPLDG